VDERVGTRASKRSDKPRVGEVTVLEEVEAIVGRQRADVARWTHERDDPISAREQASDQGAAEKPGGTCDRDAGHDGSTPTFAMNRSNAAFM
jgi:hypothetical protein